MKQERKKESEERESCEEGEEKALYLVVLLEVNWQDKVIQYTTVYDRNGPNRTSTKGRPHLQRSDGCDHKWPFWKE